jgi:DNA-3-methyladenine glycosylase II
MASRQADAAEHASFELRPCAPYSLARTASRFARFADAVDCFDGGVYARLLLIDAQPVLLRVRQVAPPSRPRLAIELRGPGAARPSARAAAERFAARALGTVHELPAFYRALGGDPLLADAMRRERGLSVAGFGAAFEALVTAILTQQVNLRFAYSIRSELARRFGARARIEGRTWIGFPTAARLARESPESLRRFRLSGAKALAIAGAARAFASGALSEAELEALDDDAAIERLLALRGVGRWTADTVLLRGLARRDAFPGGDLGVVKYLAQGLLGHRAPATESRMRAYAERWRPYRAYALVYAYAELQAVRAAASGRRA